MNKNINTPTLSKKPKEMEIHGSKRVDNYYWLNEKQNPETIQYLNDENTYYNEVTKHTNDFQKELFQEMKGRIKEVDSAVPYKKNGYFYCTNYIQGGQYPIYSRRKGSLEAEEEILFDVNKMAEGFAYYSLNSFSVSPNNELVAFGIDTISRRQYTIQIKNVLTGEIYSEKIGNTEGNVAWAGDSNTFFYTKKNPNTLRSDKIMKHKVGTPVSEDVEMFYEADDTFYANVYTSKSGQYVIISSTSTLTSEYQILNTNDHNGEFKVFHSRERALEYHINHVNDSFYIKTNKDSASNFKIMQCSEKNTSSEYWIDFIAHKDDVFIEKVNVFKKFIVVEERINGLNKIRIKYFDNSKDFHIEFDEETYDTTLNNNKELDTETIRYKYNSLTTPNSTIDYDINTKAKEVKKEQEVLGGKFKKENYISKRIWATARDGKKVAISMVYHKDTPISKDTPFLLYAYGSYGYTIPDYFSSVRLSLLDRGFIYATAHIRGSQYLGRQWYEDGKLFKKMNTFTDFIDCAKHVITEGYTSPEHLYAEGGSAGGLLMGAIINLNGELFNGVHSAVPFVDVMTTMLDDTIPLTTGEYDEWGNPNEKAAYDYMLSYSPYDNVKKKRYPNMLVTTGLHDSQVQYFEPAKWVAKLREYKTDENILLLQTDMEVGHGGASGRFNGLKDVARNYSFFISLEEGKL